MTIKDKIIFWCLWGVTFQCLLYFEIITQSFSGYFVVGMLLAGNILWMMDLYKVNKREKERSRL